MGWGGGNAGLPGPAELAGAGGRPSGASSASVRSTSLLRSLALEEAEEDMDLWED